MEFIGLQMAMGSIGTKNLPLLGSADALLPSDFALLPFCMRVHWALQKIDSLLSLLLVVGVGGKGGLQLILPISRYFFAKVQYAG